MRQLVVCCDGTWNTPGQPSVSNVRRLFNALAETDQKENPQLGFYASGVGTTGGLLARLTGGALGSDLDRRIVDAYRWLTINYQPGDQIALFGFSRGAYTVRSLAGMIKWCGLIDTTSLDGPTIDSRIEAAYTRGYRGQHAAGWSDGLGFSYDADGTTDFPVQFLGVWDTVGALGIPDNLGWLGPGDLAGRYTFHDLELDPRIPHARHAVALDEARGPFTPALWPDPAPDQDVVQVWFPGSHMDVGGGHLERGLSDGALAWMLDQTAKVTSIRFRLAARRQVHPDALDVLHDDNRNGLGPGLSLVLDAPLAAATEWVWDSRPRAVPVVDARAPRPDVHDSAHQRQREVPLAGGAYRPTRRLRPERSAEVEVFAAQPWNDTGLYLEPGSYLLSATGWWRNRANWYGPASARNARWDPVTLPLTLVGYALRTATDLISRHPSPNWTFPGERRHRDLPAMALIAVVANNPPPPGDDPRDPDTTEEQSDPPGPDITAAPTHQHLAVGDTPQPLQVTDGGYLYVYANDAWGSYGDNTGSLRLTVTRTTSHDHRVG